MRMQVIKRSAGRSSVAAAAYRAGEKLHDHRQGITHDYRNRGGVEHSEILLPDDAPAWVQGFGRESRWIAVVLGEKLKVALTARDLGLMLPRELSPDERIRVVREFVVRSFVSRGMVADVCWHNKSASDGRDQPHAHCMLLMRPLTDAGFGPKSRHDWVPDPEGRTHPDGRPVMVESNRDSWNSAAYYETCREAWEITANAALARAGSAERIDRRSFLERGLARMPEPALRLAHYLQDLRGVLKERFGQWQFARHYRAVEERATQAWRTINAITPTTVPANRRDPTPIHRAARYFAWFERQLDRLDPGRAISRDAHDIVGGPSRPTSIPDLER